MQIHNVLKLLQSQRIKSSPVLPDFRQIFPLLINGIGTSGVLAKENMTTNQDIFILVIKFCILKNYILMWLCSDIMRRNYIDNPFHGGRIG